MEYKLFNAFYDKAKESPNCEIFVQTYEQQEQTKKYSAEALTSIWEIAQKSPKELRAITALSQVAFSKLYGIPRRTIENWDSGANAPPPYLVKLIAYALWNDYDINYKERSL